MVMYESAGEITSDGWGYTPMWPDPEPGISVEDARRTDRLNAQCGYEATDW